MEHERKSFLFYGSYLDAIERIKSPEVQLELFFAIARYGIDRKSPEFENELANMAWVFIEPLLDANYQNYINGKKGGAPSESMKGNQNAKKQTQNKPTSNRKQTQNKGNVNDNANDNANVNVNANATDNVNDNVNVNKEKDSSDNEDDEWFVPYQDENGKWIVSGEDG